MKQIALSLLCLVLSCTLFSQDSTKTETPASRFHEITELSKTANSEKYGFTGEFPVKVGTGEKGGPYNQRAYLSLLRDQQGNPVEFKRVGGGCCPYKSKNALIGEYALVDTYEVIYRDKDGNKKKTIIYLSFYDYEEPMIPVGFQAAAAQ